MNRFLFFSCDKLKFFVTFITTPEKWLCYAVFESKRCHIFHHIFITSGRFLSHRKDSWGIYSPSRTVQSRCRTLFEFAVCVRASLRPLPQRRTTEMYTAHAPPEFRTAFACSRFVCTPFLLSEGNFTAKGSGAHRGAHRGARASVRKTDG